LDGVNPDSDEGIEQPDLPDTSIQSLMDRGTEVNQLIDLNSLNSIENGLLYFPMIKNLRDLQTDNVNFL